MRSVRRGKRQRACGAAGAGAEQALEVEVLRLEARRVGIRQVVGEHRGAASVQAQCVLVDTEIRIETQGHGIVSGKSLTSVKQDACQQPAAPREALRELRTGRKVTGVTRAGGKSLPRGGPRTSAGAALAHSPA